MDVVDVTAVVVTRGDVDLSRILDSLMLAGIEETIVYDNSKAPDLAVYGRYAAISHANGSLIYVQDDDVVLPPESIERLVSLAEIAPPDAVICNVPQAFREQDFYRDAALVGFGACFRPDVPARAFECLHAYRETQRIDPADPPWNGWFHRRCDIAFTALAPRVLVDVPYEDLPWASAPSRMYRQREHLDERQRMLELALRARDAEFAHA